MSPNKYHYQKSFRYPSFTVYLNSEFADVENSKGDCIFYFTRPVTLPTDHELYVGIQSFDFPNTTYNITSANNKIDIDVNDAGANTRTITEGIYTITTLITELNDNVLNTDSITAAYDTDTSKITFTHGTLEFDFDSTSTAFIPLGFAEGSTYSSIGLSLTSSQPVDLSGTKNIYISSQLPLDNMHFLSSAHGRNSNILQKVQVNVDSNSMLFWGMQKPFKNRCLEKHLNYLHIRLYGDDASTIFNPDLNWSLALEFDIYEPVFDETKTRKREK